MSSTPTDRPRRRAVADADNDASELLPRTDLVAVVVRSGKTTAESAYRTAEVLQRFAAPVLGVIFNGSDQTRGAQYYYYGYVEPSTPPQRPTTPPPFPGTDSPDEVGTPVGGI